MLPSLCGSAFGSALLATSGEVREDEKVAQLPVERFQSKSLEEPARSVLFVFFVFCGLDLMQELGRDSEAVLPNIRYAFF